VLELPTSRAMLATARPSCFYPACRHGAKQNDKLVPARSDVRLMVYAAGGRDVRCSAGIDFYPAAVAAFASRTLARSDI